MSNDAKHAAPWAARPKSAWQRGRVLAFLAVVVALLLVAHRFLPNRWVGLGSLVETFLPWLGAAVLVLYGLAILRRSATAALFTLLPLAAWVWVFAPQLLPADPEPHHVTVAQHNVSDENADVAGTVEVLLAADADIVALEEVTETLRPEYEAALATAYPYHAVQGTVGLWSRYELTDAQPVDLRPSGADASWDRGLRATVHTPAGDAAVYVAHLPSVRLGMRGFATSTRNESAQKLGAALSAEAAPTVILVGDLNGTLLDRAMSPVLDNADGLERGFELTWPTKFPLARIDHVLARGAQVVDLRTLPATDSDHLPVVARVAMPAAG